MRIVSEAVTLVTPPQTVLGGFGGPQRVTGTQSNELEANLVMFEREGELPLCLISVDLAYANQLTRDLRRSHASVAQIQFFASHTHYAPSCMPEFPGLGSYDEALVCEHAAVISQAVDNLLTALGCDSEAAEVRQVGRFEHTVARRRRSLWSPTGRRVVRFPASRRPTAAKGIVWQFVGPETPVFLWTFGCHPSGHFKHSSTSAEYIGEVRRAIRERAGAAAVVVFVQAPSGDLRQPFMSRNPRRTGLKRWLVGMVPKSLPAFVIPSEAEWQKWCGQLGLKVTALLDQPATTEDTKPINETISLIPGLPLRIVEDESAPELQVSLLTLGALKFVSVNAEITSAVAKNLKALFPRYEFATCADETVGYIASSDEERLGGYEGGDWVQAFGLQGGRAVNTADLLHREISRLVAT